MMQAGDREEHLLRSVALQNANSILLARQREEQELLRSKEALERKTRELDHSLAMMRATLESTSDAILVTDDQRKVTGFNEKYVTMWHVSPEVLTTKDHRQLLQVHARQFSDQRRFLERIDEIYTSSPPESYDVLQLVDGRVIERSSKMQIVDGKNVGRVWSFRDATERNRAEEGHQRLAAIVESSEDAIISKTLNGIITTWNAGAERMFGYAAPEVIGKPITVLIPPDRMDEEKTILEHLRKGERIDHYETVRMRKDGTALHVALTISPVKDRDGKVVGASKILRDITQRKHDEEALLRLAEERELLLAAERAARSEAERVNLMKDEFLANVSHELRTPLNAILGWSQLIASKNLSKDDLQEGLETIQRSARAQTQLIEDLLDMSRIASGRVRLDVQQTDLLGVVEAAISSVRPSIHAKEIRLRQMLDPSIGPVTGDPARLQQVVWNLLSNAVKFTPKCGKIDVHLQRVNSHLEIVVRDSGPGIKPEFLPHVFEKFRQADSTTTRQYGGLGLGLAIVKHLVELHGGAVSVASAGEGQGATFTVRLPLAPVRDDKRREHPAAPTRTIPEYEGIELAGVKVLVVEDETDARDLIKRVLVQCKADVCAVGSAAEALELLKTQKLDVLVSDIGMPEMDGYQFIRQVRLLSLEARKIPAIALTAFARSEDRTRAMMAGYQMHIAKPIEPQELIATVASFAGRTAERNPQIASAP